MTSPLALDFLRLQSKLSAAGKLAAKSGLRTGLKNVVSRSVPYVKAAKHGALRGFFGGLALAIVFANTSGQGHNGQSPSQG